MVKRLILAALMIAATGTAEAAQTYTFRYGLDGYAGTRKQGSKAGCLNTKEAEYRYHQDHPQNRSEDVDQIANNRHIEAATAQTFAHNAHSQLNQPATSDP